MCGSTLQEVQSDRYDPSIKFKDPISNFNDLTGYRVNVRFLATAFDVDFKLLDIGVVSPETIVARWTMEAKTRLPPLLPWKPTAVFTGTSEYKVNPDSGLITEHIDKWDSVADNEFLSLEAIQYILTSFSQVLHFFTPAHACLWSTCRGAFCQSLQLPAGGDWPVCVQHCTEGQFCHNS